MLFLTFTVGNKDFAINSNEIHEILPLVKIHPLPQPSTKFMGYINYRGSLIPVIDLAVFLGFLPSASKLSTRIVIIDFLREDGDRLLLGVLVENATDLEKFDEEEINVPQIDVYKHPLVKGIIMQNDRTLYLLSFRSLKTLQLET
jgi:chemotaxis-related protein WspB